MSTYQRIETKEGDIDWTGPGWYMARREYTNASGEWIRWHKLDEPGDYDKASYATWADTPEDLQS